MRTHLLVTSALLGAFTLTLTPTPTATAAVPAVRPTKPVKLANPAGTAKAIAALARFANGKLGASDYDRRVKTTLGKVSGAQQIAKRLVQRIEAMPTAERTKVFPGVDKVDSITTQTFDRAGYEATISAAVGKIINAATVLAPDPFNPQDKAAYELFYRGARCDKTADADGTDEPVVYVNVIGPSYNQSPVFLPGSGTGTATAGALDQSQAAKVWSSPTWPGGWNSGIVILTAVLEDEGDLVERKQELDLLINFALSETEEDKVTQDRMEVLRRELEDALALLHLANPARWSPKAVQVRKLTSTEYDDLFLKPSTASPVPHKLTMEHDPRGSSYTLFFDVPPPNLSYKTISVKIKEVEALGADRDAAENHVADLGAAVTIGGNTNAEGIRVFTRNKDLVKPGWTVERDVLATLTASVTIKIFDDEPVPSCACNQWSGWPFSSCTSFCATAEKKAQCKEALSTYYYTGTCPRGQTEYDINPKPDTNDGGWMSTYHDVNFTVDLTTNKLAGDVSGAPGTFTAYGTAGAGIQAKVVFEVSIK